MAGSAGKYMSIAKGPTAVRSPSTIALLANDWIMAELSERSPDAARDADRRVLHGRLLRRNKASAACVAQATIVQP
jgi:hypothetical protein